MEPLRQLAKEKLRGKKAIAVMSAKGGVGKSLVSALLALSLRGAVLVDLDVHTMATTKLFGLEDKLHEVTKNGIEPFKLGELGVVSLGGIVKDKYVVLPGGNAGEVMESLVAYANLGDANYVVFDLPPGLGDEVLTLERLTDFFPVVVTTPSAVSVKVVEYVMRYLNEREKRPLLVVNMAYMDCGDDKVARPFGDLKNAEDLAKRYNAPVVELPIDPSLESYIGKVHEYDGVVKGKVKKELVPYLT
ncbi:MAG: P-loop NTPase [Candidatus Aramenus sp.]|nr:P-loop NTPase [Candidatus Aramenus sp.]